jgi:hypothetical protein
MKRLSFIIAYTILVSCQGKNKVPADLIQPPEMQKILWDVIRAQALAIETARKDSLVNEVAETKVLTQKVLVIHHTTSTVFNKSYNWYTNHPDIMKIIFDSLSTQSQHESQSEVRKTHRSLKLKPIK